MVTAAAGRLVFPKLWRFSRPRLSRLQGEAVNDYDSYAPVEGPHRRHRRKRAGR
jgi:hypothetical protein